VINLGEEQYENTFDSMRVNSKLFSNEINESESQNEKHTEQRI
jgi:hypothetical protein